ncbi:MAG: aminomethyltransferase family protein, partial [Anaerolineae bacterium]|nr:aminomethyltransferase family protein [Anaerolineae bacterium]
GRPAKTTPLYETFKQDNAVFGVSYGLEFPLYFAPAGEEPVETPGFHRSNAFKTVAHECQVVRDTAGLFDLSAYAKYEVSGPHAAKWLDKVIPSHLPSVGRMRLAPLLNANGRLMGDLTVMCLAENRFMLVGSGYLQGFHMRWLNDQVGKARVSIINLSEELLGLSLCGPKSRKVLQQLAGESISNDDFPFLSAREMEIGLAPAIVVRVSFTGELGYEIYVPAMYLKTLYDQLKLAANDGNHKVQSFGVYGLLSLRLEKSYGIWSREFSPDYTPAMCGLDQFIAYEKADFMGRDAVLRDREKEPAQRLVTLELSTDEADAGGYEPIWSEDQMVGFTTSGGYGHTVNKSLAMGYIKTEEIDANRSYEITILGKRKSAQLLTTAPYDPEGSRLRGTN